MLTCRCADVHVRQSVGAYVRLCVSVCYVLVNTDARQHVGVYIR